MLSRPPISDSHGTGSSSISPKGPVKASPKAAASNAHHAPPKVVCGEIFVGHPRRPGRDFTFKSVGSWITGGPGMTPITPRTPRESKDGSMQCSPTPGDETVARDLLEDVMKAALGDEPEEPKSPEPPSIPPIKSNEKRITQLVANPTYSGTALNLPVHEGSFGAIESNLAQQRFLQASAILGDANYSERILHEVLGKRGISQRPMTERDREVQDEVQLEQERKALAEMIMSKFRCRGIHAIRKLRRMCHGIDLDLDGVCLGHGLEGVFSSIGLKLPQEDYKNLLQLFGTGPGGKYINYVLLFQCGANFNEVRREVVLEAYQYLCESSPGGALTLSALEANFWPQALESHLTDFAQDNQKGRDRADRADQLEEFLSHWSHGTFDADGVISWTDFCDYYLDVSLAVADDRSFNEFVCKSYGIHMTDIEAKRVFRKLSGGRDVVSDDEFLAVLKELNPDLHDKELLAWLESVDEDGDGEVVLQEFLDSQLLRVKHLFRKYDTDGSGSLEEPEFAALLQEIDVGISNEEATSLFRCVGGDDDDGVTFLEFLESRLLKLHRLFVEYDADGSRDLSENEWKQLLGHLDKTLSDFDIAAVYRAVDSDNNTRVSFIEFVQSLVVKSKELFVKFDEDRDRRLSRYQYEKALRHVDHRITQEEMDACFDLDKEQTVEGVECVSFARFLYPCTLKIVLLLRKYNLFDTPDHRLNAVQIKKILMEQFPTASMEDLELWTKKIVQESGNDEGKVAFAMYVRHLPGILRQRDIDRARSNRLRSQRKGSKAKGPRRRY